MNHYMDFGPQLIRQRSEEMQEEVRSVQLEEALRHNIGDQGRKEKAKITNTLSTVIWVERVTVFMVGLAMMVALMIGATSVARPAHAQVAITVNTATDEENTDGDCSLREAIIAANTNAAVDACMAGSATTEDLIRFADGVGG